MLEWVDWNATGTWVGSLATAAATVFSWAQAGRAKREADRAETVRSTIAGRVAQTDLSEVDSLATAACDAMAKYGPQGTVATLSGYEPQSDAAAVQALTQALHRHNATLKAELGAECAQVRDRLNLELAAFSAQASPDLHLVEGRKVYFTIAAFAGNIQASLRKRLVAAAE